MPSCTKTLATVWMSWNCGHQTGDGKTLPGGVDLGLGWCQVYQLWVDFPDFINLLEDLVFVLPQNIVCYDLSLQSHMALAS